MERVRLMKNWIKLIIAFLIFIITALLFFSPILISVLIGNWWFILLFGVTWIPALGLILIIASFINVFYD